MKISNLHCLLIIGLSMAILSGGCAPTIKQISDNAIETEAVLTARDEVRQQGRQEGINLCRLEMDERLRDFIRKYRDQLLYLELVKGGAILPAQIRLIYNPAKISHDGSSYSAPNLTWKIVSAPQFVSDDSQGDWLNKDRANFCYFLVESFFTENEAFLFLGNTKKPPEVFLTIAPHGDNGRWAVVAKAFKTKCDDAVSFYKKLGRQPIKVD
ncbi:MAG: hypothetical protein H6Q52_3323 [Deltaproteobacteria bacterium]|nr:hypothetical protein [Deltaproteobacteria bacterium]